MNYVIKHRDYNAYLAADNAIGYRWGNLADAVRYATADDAVDGANARDILRYDVIDVQD